VILWIGQQVDSILSFKTNGSKMTQFYLIRNPDKLRHITSDDAAGGAR
jgi:hypothetical protein